MMLYIVEALRYGNEKLDSYVVGVYDTLQGAAEAMAVEELKQSAGNYDCIIHTCELNAIDADALQSAKDEHGEAKLLEEVMRIMEKFK